MLWRHDRTVQGRGSFEGREAVGDDEDHGECLTDSGATGAARFWMCYDEIDRKFTSALGTSLTTCSASNVMLWKDLRISPGATLTIEAKYVS